MFLPPLQRYNSYEKFQSSYEDSSLEQADIDEGNKMLTGFPVGHAQRKVLLEKTEISQEFREQNIPDGRRKNGIECNHSRNRAVIQTLACVNWKVDDETVQCSCANFSSRGHLYDEMRPKIRDGRGDIALDRIRRNIRDEISAFGGDDRNRSSGFRFPSSFFV